MMFDDFYTDDYNEFDRQIQEFKDSLKESVRTEFLNEMDQLRKENEELQDIKKNWNTIKEDLNREIREWKLKKENALTNAKKEFYNASLKSLIEELFKIKDLYYIFSDNFLVDKCDKCDEDRKIDIKDVFGRIHKISCECFKHKKMFFVKKADVKLYISKKYRDISFAVEIRQDDFETDLFTGKNNEINYAQTLIENFDENDLPTTNYYYLYFTKKEEAQKYCDYMNKIESEKE